MSIGLGHKYLVRLLSRFHGTLEDCIVFMKNNISRLNQPYEWYELNPCVDVKNGICEEFDVLVVEIGLKK